MTHYRIGNKQSYDRAVKLNISLSWSYFFIISNTFGSHMNFHSMQMKKS